MRTFQNIAQGLIIAIPFLLVGCKAATYKETAGLDTVGYAVEESDSSTSGAGYEFESDSLSAKSIQAFEQRAVQKLKDVSDYIGILSNSSLDLSFRKQARRMMLEGFINPHTEVFFSTLPDNQLVNFTITQFADSLLANRYSNLKIEVENPQITQPLRFQKEQIYVGRIAFDLKITQGNQTLTLQPMKATVYLLKREKSFGAYSTEVWEVFLGDVGISL